MAHNDFVAGGTGSGAWTGTEVVHAMMEKFDQRQFEAINGDLGGTWAPSSIITVGGQGIEFAGTNHQVTGTLHVNNGAFLIFDSGSVVRGTVTLGDGTTSAAVTVSHGSLTIAAGTAFAVHTGLAADNSTWSMVGTIVNMTGGAQLGITSGGQFQTTGCFVGFNSSTVDFADSLIKNGRADYQDIASNPLWDANRTFTVADGRIINGTGITTGRTWILATTSAAKGNRITFLNRGSVNVLTLHVGSDSYSLYVNPGNNYKVEFVFSGTAWVLIANDE